MMTNHNGSYYLLSFPPEYLDFWLQPPQLLQHDASPLENMCCVLVRDKVLQGEFIEISLCDVSFFVVHPTRLSPFSYSKCKYNYFLSDALI